MKRKQSLLLTFLIISTFCYSADRDNDVFKTDSKIIYDVCFTNKGGALVIADNNTVRVYSTKDKKLLNEFKNGHKKQILAIDISKDSTLLVSGGKDSTVVLWDFISGKVIRILPFQDGIVTSVNISPDKRFLLFGGTDRKVFLYDILNDRLLHEFSDHTDDVTSVKFSPDGNLVASAGGDGLINVYDTFTFKRITTLQGHKSWVRDLCFSSNSLNLYSCGDDSMLNKWDVSDKNGITIKKKSREGYNWLLCVDINEDNVTYATGSFDGRVKIITSLCTYKTGMGSPVNKVVFMPNQGCYLKVAIATSGKGVFLIDAKDM